MTKQDIIDITDVEFIDLGEASKETEGFPGDDSEGPGLQSIDPV